MFERQFEFTYELCWKFMKRWLENNMGSAYVDGVPRRELFRLAAEHQLIKNVEAWMVYHEPYSDLDLAIVGKEKVPREKMIKLKEIFQESYSPFRVDVVDWNRIFKNFRKIIEEKCEVV